MSSHHKQAKQTAMDSITVPPADDEPLVWRPEGRLGWMAAGDVPALWLDQLHAHKAAEVVIDLREVVGLDSGALRSLANLVEAAMRNGARRVAIEVAAPQVLNLLRLGQFDLICDLRARS